MNETQALTPRERKLLSLAGRGFQFGEHSIDCDRCNTRIPYRTLPQTHADTAPIEADYKLSGDVILCRLCHAESNGPTEADDHRATFMRDANGVRQIPEPTIYPPGTDIDVLLDAPIHGNAYSDGPLNIALLKYAVEDNNPPNKRRAAIGKLDEIVGEPKENGTDRHVIEKFMLQMKDYVDDIKANPGDTDPKAFFTEPS